MRESKIEAYFVQEVEAAPVEADLRDQFAMAALGATLALWEPNGNQPSHMAERAYAIADAMMEARRA